ncbi:nucleotidyltransferase family protein [Rubrolithibacter danxiaensis]|uniref:nucleotidyltransferase family protein n=1 Tax=Rubrolithibacter danxiaensis TaxID=3390805 RepID=UPI003BF840D1
MPIALTQDSILETLHEHQHKLKSFGVLEIGLFGSYAKKTQRKESDIDLLVDIDKSKKTFRNFMALAYYLEDLFKCRVDLITKQSLSPYIGPYILKSVKYAAL